METTGSVLNVQDNELTMFTSILKSSQTSTMTATLPHSSQSIEPSVTIHNVVATVNLGLELNLLKIYTHTRNSEYNPSRFSAVVLRILEPKTTALIFKSGKVIVTGAKTEANVLLAARKFARIIQKLGFVVKFEGFTINNVVASCDLKFPVNLDILYQKHGQFSRYEPDLFPAVIYRIVKPRVVLLIFANGKIILTGAKSTKEIQDALKLMQPVIKSFRKL